MVKLSAGFKAQGFTLVELMIVLAIAAVLMALAAPSFNRIIQENSTRTQASRVVTSMNAARSSAVKNNTPVSVCENSSSIQDQCTASPSNSLSGWLVFTDINEDQDVDTDDIIVQVYDGLPSSYYVKDFTSLTYFPDGTTSLGSDETILICPPDREEKYAWSISITTVGRPTMTRPAAGDCD